MGSFPGVHHLHAVRAFEKIGYVIVRQSKHIVMSDGVRTLILPRHNPINANTMGSIIKGAGLTNDAFRALL